MRSLLPLIGMFVAGLGGYVAAPPVEEAPPRPPRVKRVIVTPPLVFDLPVTASAVVSVRASRPSSADAMLEAARTAIEARAFARAARLLERVLEKDPKNAQAHLLAGIAGQLLGDLDRARRAYANYVRYDPSGEYVVEVEKVLSAGLDAKNAPSLVALR